MPDRSLGGPSRDATPVEWSLRGHVSAEQ